MSLDHQEVRLRAIERIKRGEIAAAEAAGHFEHVAQRHSLRETGYGRRLVDMLIAGVRAAQADPLRGH